MLQQQHHARAYQPLRGQVLARQAEQQLRRVVFHRPRERELIELLPPRPVNRPPAGIDQDLAKMFGTGLPPVTVSGQLARRDVQPFGEPAHRRGRGRGHHIGYEPQPRQAAQLHARAQHVDPTVELAQERHIRAGQREIPDQLRPGDLREASQPRQLLGGKHVPRGHTNHLRDPAQCFMTQDTLDSPRHKLTQPDPELRKRLEALFFRWILRAGPLGSRHGIRAWW